MFTLVLSPLLLLLLILLLRSDDDRFGRRLRQEDDDFATPTTDDEEAENASACILQIYIYIYNVCVCVIKLLRSLKTCGCLSIMCSRSFYIENFIHSDESCLAVHWLVRGNNRRGKGILFQKNEKEKQSSRHFLSESTHHDVAAFSHPRSANQEERKTAEKSVNVYVSAFFFFNFFFLLLQEFARSSRCRFFNKNSHRKRHHPATPFS